MLNVARGIQPVPLERSQITTRRAECRPASATDEGIGGGRIPSACSDVAQVEEGEAEKQNTVAA